MNFNDENNQTIKKPKVTKVRNKSAAQIQITAEQLLREAKERELEATPKAPQQKITTEAEKLEYQLQKRQDYENNIRKDRLKIINYIKYANFEKKQGEIDKARNVYERSLNIHSKDVSIWLKYAEMEIESKQVQHARNLFDRAISILPRIDQLWYKYVYMEEKLKNIEAARRIFKNWMRWEPKEQAWHSFINMEMKYGELDNAHEIYKRFVDVHPDEKNWIKWARFEERNRRPWMARNVFESAVYYFGSDNPPSNVLKEFAKFEERQGEHERVKAIYKYSLEILPKDMSEGIYSAYHEYEKKFGDKCTIQESIVVKRKHYYEKKIEENPMDYDEWFCYLKMMEDEGQDKEHVRNLYERAISNLPLIAKKDHWRRYIYIWIKYAIFEELDCQNAIRAKEIYTKCLEIIPSKKFTFSKIWIYLAEIEIRENNLCNARKILGNAIGRFKRNKIFRYYIKLETNLLEYDRVRKLYENFVANCPSYQQSWIEYADFEQRCMQFERVRAIYELALDTELEIPNYVWKSYIDFELNIEEFELCWKLFRRYLEIEEHACVWFSFAKAQILDYDPEQPRTLLEAIENARKIFEEANQSLRKLDNNQRQLLLNQWKDFEEEYGTDETLAIVTSKLPRKVTERKRIDNDDGTSTWVETYVLDFPDDIQHNENSSSKDEFINFISDWDA